MARAKKKSTRKKAAKKRAKKAAPASLKLPAESGIRDVADLYQQFSAVLEVPTLEIDAGDVDRIDTAVLQALTALVIARRGAERETRWTGDPSGAFRRASKLLAIGGPLGLQESD